MPSETQTDILVDELDSVTLRLLLRTHVVVGGVAAFVGLAALFIPDDTWILWVVKWALGLPALFVAVIRMMQINGIYVELKKRSRLVESAEAVDDPGGEEGEGRTLETEDTL